MALEVEMAHGTEEPCHKCGRKFKPGDLKVKRPSRGGRGSFKIGSNLYCWVHEKCAPTRTSRHNTARRRR